jgi:hypothetical protein
MVQHFQFIDTGQILQCVEHGSAEAFGVHQRLDVYIQ